jgi:hypothetical protein
MANAIKLEMAMDLSQGWCTTILRVWMGNFDPNNLNLSKIFSLTFQLSNLTTRDEQRKAKGVDRIGNILFEWFD